MKINNFIKSTIQRFVNLFGYSIVKTFQKELELDVYKQLYPTESIQYKRFYNVGSGGFYHPYWTNIDLKSEWYRKAQKHSFINFDLESLEKLPIPDNSAEIVYTSHTIEHITNSASKNLFKEAYRVLKPHGVFRFSTPNMVLNHQAYLRNDKHYYYWHEENTSITQMFFTHFASQLSYLYDNGISNKPTDKDIEYLLEQSVRHALDYYTGKCDLKIHKEYLGNHINWWDEQKARKMLENSGFEPTKIYRSGYGQSFNPILRNTDLFDNTHPKISLYMEAIKGELG